MTVLILDAPLIDDGPPASPPSELLVDGPLWLPPWPSAPEVVPWEAPDVVDTTRPRMVQVVVSTILSFRWLGELLGARIEGPRTLGIEMGSGSIRLSVPMDDPSVLATLMANVVTWNGETTGKLSLIDRAVHVVVDGQVTPGYVLRTEVEIRDGRLYLTGHDPTTLFAGRFLGEAERIDLLRGRGSFPGTATLRQLGIIWTGNPTDIQWTTEGVRGGRALRIRGNRLAGHKLRIASVLEEPAGTTEQKVTVRSAAFLSIPDAALEQTGMMLTEVFQNGIRYSPPLELGDTNPWAALVEEETPRGVFDRSPVTSKAQLPAPPYRVTIATEILPQHHSEWTGISEITQFRRDTLSTGVPVDLVDHLKILIRESQTRWGKTGWSLPVDVGAPCGVSELGVWRDEDEIPLTEAINAICQRDDGPDPPWVDGRWRVQVGRRRGRLRPDVRLTNNEVLAWSGWREDPGGQISQLRGLTDYGEHYWRPVSVATDTSRTDGHLIEAQTRAPNDMLLLVLDQWTKARLRERAQRQATTTVVVPGWLGRRLAVGDTFEVWLTMGYGRLDGPMRIDTKAINDYLDLEILELGSDEEAA